MFLVRQFAGFELKCLIRGQERYFRHSTLMIPYPSNHHYSDEVGVVS